MASQSNTGMKKTLGLTGVTVNAMALIAPGAFCRRPIRTPAGPARLGICGLALSLR